MLKCAVLAKCAVKYNFCVHENTDNLLHVVLCNVHSMYVMACCLCIFLMGILLKWLHLSLSTKQPTVRGSLEKSKILVKSQCGCQ